MRDQKMFLTSYLPEVASLRGKSAGGKGGLIPSRVRDNSHRKLGAGALTHLEIKQ